MARLTVLVVFVASVLMPFAEASWANPRSVLLIYGEAGPVPAITSFDRGIKAALHADSTAPVRFYTESLDSSWQTDARYEEALAKLLVHKYAGRKIDVIVPCLDSAIQFTLERRETLFPGVPVVFCGASPAIQEAALPPDVTGVAMRFDWSAAVDLALRLHPGTDRIVYVGGVSGVARAYEADARRAFSRFQGRLQFDYLTGLTMSQILDRVRSLPKRAVIIHGVLLVDAAGASFTGPEGLSLVRNASAVPIYSTRDSLLGHGIVGGPLVGFEAQGVRAGQLALRVLGGERLGPAHIVLDTNAYMFDARELARFGIDEARLPAGSSVQFRSLSLWQQYRWYIVSAACLFAVETALLVTLLAQMARRKRAEERLRLSGVELRRLTGRLFQAQETEARRIARELHDDLGQRLALLAVEMDSLRQRPPELASTLDARIQEMIVQTKQLSSSVHDLSRQLHPSRLEQLGLVAAIRGLCYDVARTDSLKVDFTDRGVPPMIPSDTALCLYRIAQEGLRNAVKHSRAQHAGVELAGIADTLSLRIADDGVGFDPKLIRGQGGLGLVSMRERVLQLGGEITIDSQPYAGTRLVVRVPLNSTERIADGRPPLGRS